MSETPDSAAARAALADEVASAVIHERDQARVLARIAGLEQRVAAIHTLLGELVLRGTGQPDRRSALRHCASDPALGVALGLHAYRPASTPPSAAPCPTVLPGCRSACCCLNEVPLALDELDDHPWDERRPFLMARRTDGACVRLGADGTCSVYNDRPRFCRDYTCEKDRRVWEHIERNLP